MSPEKSEGRKGWFGRRCGALVCVSVLASFGCNHQAAPSRGVPNGAGDESAPKATQGSALGTPEDASPAPTNHESSAAWDTGCRTRKEVEEGNDLRAKWMIGGPLGIVRVAPNDVLNLRSQADPKSPVVTSLGHDRSDVGPTGNVCKVDGSLWFEIEDSGARGWANGRYLAPLSAVQDFTPEYAALAPNDASSAQHFAEALAGAFNEKYSNEPEGRREVQVLGVEVQDHRAAVTVFECCALDDSIFGKQLVVEAREVGGKWVFERAEGRYVCARQVSDGRCN